MIGDTLVLDADLAFRLTRQRVMVAGTGMAGTKSVENVIEHSVVLPGGFMALFRKTAGAGTGQLFYASGRPLSGVIDLGLPDMFASIMHNVDVSVMQMVPDFPTSGFALADMIAMAERDGMVENDPGKYVDLPDMEDGWQLSESARTYLLGMHAHVPEIAGAYDAFLNGESMAPYGEPTVSSLVRWNLQLEGWLLDAAGVQPETWPIGDYVWRRLETVPGVVGAARAVGQLEGKVLRSHEGMSDKTVVQRLHAIINRGDFSDKMRDGNDYYALATPSGVVQMLACIETGSGKTLVWARPEWVRSVEAPEAEAVIEFLRDEVSGLGPSNGISP